MSKYYSASTGGFYPSDFKSDYLASGTWPIDATEVTEDAYNSFMEAQKNGLMIVPGDNGYPMVISHPLPPLAELQDRIWGKIKEKRTTLMHGGVKVGNYWFHSDPDSRVQQLGLVAMGTNIPQGLKWKTMSGDFVDMDATLASTILLATGANDNAIFTKAEEHKAAMLLESNPELYDFSIGWPETFTG